MPSIVKSGSRGVDSSFSHPPVPVLLGEGFTFRVGYISRPPASVGKNITVPECEETIAAGMRLLLVLEQNQTRATLGAAFGTIDGLAAAEMAQDRGQPFDVPILFADDTGTTAANLPKKVAYMEAAAVACAPYPMGIYGGVKILQATLGLWIIGWVPINAWSWSVSLARKPGESDADYNARGRAAARQAAIDVGAHCIQHQGYYIGGTYAVDPNEAIADFPAWGLTVEDDDTLDIRLLTLVDADAQFLATTTADGRALDCRWADGSAKTQAVVAAHRAAAAGKQTVFEQSGNIAGLANVYLHGPLPTGDSKHTWSGVEFAGLDQMGTVDQTARDSAANANAAVARVGQVVGGIQHGLDIAAKATA